MDKTETIYKKPAAVLDDVFEEIRRAEGKFPGWPEDVVHEAAIVAEEAGELMKASLDFYYHRWPTPERVYDEAVQTAAMALRFLFNLPLL